MNKITSSPFLSTTSLTECPTCHRGWHNQAEADKILAEIQAKQLSDQRAIEDEKRRLVEQARREEKAKFDLEREDEVRRQVNVGIAANRVEFNDKLQAQDTLIARLRTDNANQARLLDERKAKDKANAAEDDLAAVLKAGAPHEEIRRVKSGARGGDVIESVSHKGRVVAGLLWEDKVGYERFSNEWPRKALDNSRREGTDVATIVADVMPPGVDGYGRTPEGVFCCTREYVPFVQRFLRFHVISMALERARGGTGANADAVLAHFMAGKGREAIERAKQAGKAIVEKGRLLKEYGETHDKQLKDLVRRQDDALAEIFAALNTYQNGDDDAA